MPWQSLRLFYFRLLARSSTPSRPSCPQRSSGISVHGASISQLSSFPTLSSPAATAPIPSPRKFLRASPRITLVGGDSPPLAATPSACLDALLVAGKPRDCHDNAPRVTFSGRHCAALFLPKFKGTSLVCCARTFRAGCFAVCCQPSAQILPAPSDEQGCPSQPLLPPQALANNRRAGCLDWRPRSPPRSLIPLCSPAFVPFPVPGAFRQEDGIVPPLVIPSPVCPRDCGIWRRVGLQRSPSACLAFAVAIRCSPWHSRCRLYPARRSPGTWAPWRSPTTSNVGYQTSTCKPRLENLLM
jgi:hypothetical protein